MIIVRDFEREIVRVSPFSCGRPELDRWLKEQAGQKDRRDNARTLLALDEAQARVAGYVATTTYELAPRTAGSSLGRTARDPIPAVLIARLAVDQDYQGKGIGRLILFDVLRRIADASRSLGFEVVVVDAIDEDAACFYLKAGFRRFVDHQLTLFLTTRDLRLTLEGL